MTHAQAVQNSAAERYLLDEMAELERYAFEEHYFSCLECAEDVRTGGLMRDGVRAGLVEAKASGADAAAIESNRRGWLASTALPWAVAASLGVLAGYQSIGLRQPAFQAQALAPITLRPASRGAEAVVPLRPGASAVTLALDVAASEPGELSYDLRSSGNAVISSGRAQAPDAGIPLFLMLPVWTLKAGEHYILTVRHATSGNPAGEFRFGVTQ